MNAQETRPKYSVINIAWLALIYLFLTGITVFLVRSFLEEILSGGAIPATQSLVVFFTIPAVLLVFLLVLAAGVIKDHFKRKAGSRFETKLLAYFVAVILFAALPMILITNFAVSEVVRFWKALNVNTAMDEARNFAMETYTLNMEKLERLAGQGLLSGRAHAGLKPEGMPEEVVAFQDFNILAAGKDESGEAPEPLLFYGPDRFRLDSAPAVRDGFVPRELPRDANIVRFVLSPSPGTARVISWNLGDGFDPALEVIETEREHFILIDSIRFNIRRVLVFYYGVFFLPALLLTLIIAISFARRISSPITELSEATRRVAGGDFTIRLMPRKEDELALLVRSFNSMVENLERSQTELLKAEKISAWQSIAQQLAHEIKNPLTPIRLSAERVLRRWRNEPEKIGEILENSMMTIIQEAEGIATLLTEFRSFSKPSEPSRDHTDLLEVTKEISGNYNSSHPEVRFNIENTEAGISLKIDKLRLFQILSNLIGNSIDAMNGSGSIEIRSDIVKKRESGYCRLSIQDSGKGISKEDARKLFAPYFTTKESGTGLGLPIVERIVSDHGGTIWCNSAEGAGATFFIDLPLENKNVV